MEQYRRDKEQDDNCHCRSKRFPVHMCGSRHPWVRRPGTSSKHITLCTSSREFNQTCHDVLPINSQGRYPSRQEYNRFAIIFCHVYQKKKNLFWFCHLCLGTMIMSFLRVKPEHAEKCTQRISEASIGERGGGGGGSRTPMKILGANISFCPPPPP